MNLILSSLHKLTVQDLLPFVESLALIECQARRIMVCYDTDEERDTYLAVNGWEIAKSKPVQSIHPFIQRFADYAEILRQIPRCDMVLSTDCRDVVFQRDPFRHATCHYAINVAWEGINHEDDEWATEMFAQNFPMEWDRMKDKPSYCAGTILGLHDKMREMFSMIFRTAMNGAPGGKSDQPAFNLLCNGELTREVFWPDEGLACTCGTMLNRKFDGKRTCPDPVMINGRVIEGFSLVHQYERIPGLAEDIVRHYVRPIQPEPEKANVYSGPPEVPQYDDNALSDMVSGKVVALVGPSPSLKDKGKEIDEADVVARMNRGFPIEPRDTDDAGELTDVLYHCLNEEDRCGGSMQWDEMGKENVMLCSPYPRGVTPFHQDVCRVMAQNRHHQIPFHTINREYYLDIAKATGTRPNTGIAAIMDLLAHGPKELRVYGFTFFEDGWRESYKVDDRLQHYLESGFDGNHRQDTQRALIEDMAEKFPQLHLIQH